MITMNLCKYGTNRVLKPLNVLPQAAVKIDNTMNIYDNEVLIDVSTLNIDSASFTQIKKACNNDVSKMKQMILDIVNDRGKMQNPVTGSGGMLIGTIKEIGSKYKGDLSVGDKVATLVSLSLTPLQIEEILSINLDNDQVSIIGSAILFESGIYANIPNHLDEKLVLAALDVAGAPAQVHKLVKSDDTVAIIGAAGKSGVLCCYQASLNASKGKVIGIVYNQAERDFLNELNICDEVIVCDATMSLELLHKVSKNNIGLCDVVINCVNVENTEMSSILITKDEGVVYFFSMATSFTKAALGAEGIGKDVTMIVGNGYTKGHALLTLGIIEKAPNIKRVFINKYT